MSILRANLFDLILIFELDDLGKQGKLKVDSFEPGKELRMQQKHDFLDECLKAIKGMDIYGSIDAIDLCLVPDVIIPPMFRVPDFEKYDRTKCLKAYIAMYCQNMVAHAHDKKLLIYYFQNTLTKSVARWYVQLNGNHISSWKDLVRAFIVQYKHITDLASDRLFLQNMEKRDTESFKEYAQRWRDVVAQVQ
ncbi:uncharacterized protein LOC110428148 [Herrania umbratica]|uniref:Uncharacterized protein LOC110428148 n=1 Tax=Herrania umbratica TaxID=108875 RepID=A0A6J1BK91_9ROSI|nr:uncharacterized protein LOC110428148 [Herrania umbratica]